MKSCTLCPGVRGRAGPRPLASAALPTRSKPHGQPSTVGGAVPSAARPAAGPYSFPLYLKMCFLSELPLSHENFGKEISTVRLAEIFLELQGKGLPTSLNLVTATQYLPSIRQALELAAARASHPVVYNSGGYERTETIREFSDCIDIWLPDLKYYDSSLSEKYSAAQNYFSMASKAIKEMIRISGGWPGTRKTRGF